MGINHLYIALVSFKYDIHIHIYVAMATTYKSRTPHSNSTHI